LAEFYAVDGTAEPGDVVIPSTTGGDYAVKRAPQAKAANVIGIVSTNPTADGIMGHNVTASSRQPVALAGRIPLKVSLENGPVDAGDLLTPASSPGAAMKAASSDPVIGVALEAYNESSQRVSKLVAAEEEDRNKVHKDELPHYVSAPDGWPNDVGKIMVFLRLSGGGSQLSQTDLQQAVFSGGIVSGDTTFNGLATFASTVHFSSDTTFDGTATFNGNVVVNDSTAGTALLPTGETSAVITFATPHPYTPVVNSTPAQFVNGAFRITDVTPQSFTLELATPQDHDVQFHWTAIDTRPTGF
jgi:hypothetical protein